MTAKEAAKLTFQDGIKHGDAIKAFISTADPKSLLEFIQNIHASTGSFYFTWAKATLDVRLAEAAAESAAKMESQTNRLVIQTDTLVIYTKSLHWLTVALFVLSAVQLAAMFYFRP